AWRVKQAAEADYPHVYAEVQLGPLPREEGERLLDHLLAGASMPARLRALILDKAEGNPLFLEEIVRSLLQDGQLVDPGNLTDVPLPETVLGIVSARIDRLEEPVRQVLQAAAVIGRTFPYAVLRKIADSANGALDRH